MPIIVRNVFKSFDGREVLRDVTLGIYENRIYGVLGPNGAGKTTLFRLIVGAIRPSRGMITVDGLHWLDPLAKSRLAYAPELPSMPQWMTGCSYISSLWLLEGFSLKDAREHALSGFKMFNAEGLCDKRVGDMSKGQKKLVTLVEALFSPFKKKYIFLDEPFAGLSPDNTSVVLKRIVSLWRNGSTIVIATHIPDLISSIVTDVVIVNNGRVVLSERIGRILDRYGYRYKLVVRLSPVSEGRDIAGLLSSSVGDGVEVSYAGDDSIVVYSTSIDELIRIINKIRLDKGVSKIILDRYDISDVYRSVIGGVK